MASNSETQSLFADHFNEMPPKNTGFTNKAKETFGSFAEKLKDIRIDEMGCLIKNKVQSAVHAIENNSITRRIKHTFKQYDMKDAKEKYNVTVLPDGKNGVVLHGNTQNIDRFLNDNGFEQPRAKVENAKFYTQRSSKFLSNRGVGSVVSTTYSDCFNISSTLKIIVKTGDITKLKADCIVSSTHPEFKNSVGVSKAIAINAGPKLTEWSTDYAAKKGAMPVTSYAVSDGFNLPSKHIIHVVVPHPKHYKHSSECLDTLTVTLKNVLREVAHNNWDSVAIPPLGSGQYGMDKESVAKAMVTAISDLSVRGQLGKALKEITVVDINTKVLPFISSLLCAKFGSKAEDQNHLTRIDTDKINGDLSTFPSRNQSNEAPSTSSASFSILNSTTSGTRQNPNTTNDNGIAGEDDFCVICCDAITDKKILSKCKHAFCTDCIELAFQFKPACPTCNTIYGELTGSQPKDGRMNVTKERIALPGFPNCGTIVIEYSFLDGVQGPDNPSPGKRYRGIRRTCYLPDNAEGNKVLKLLRKAFDAQLTFTIGRSTTTGHEGVLTWNDIHHKTRRDGGPDRFGYPDTSYLGRVQDELAAKGIL